MPINRLIANAATANLAQPFIAGNNFRKRSTALDDNNQAAVLNNAARQNALDKQGNVNRLLQGGASINEIAQVDPATAAKLSQVEGSQQKQKNIDKDRIFQNLADFGFAKTKELFPDVNIDPSFSVIDNDSPEQLQLRDRFRKGSGITINTGDGGQPKAEADAESSGVIQRAEDLGVPVAPAPWQNISDSKKRDDARIKFATAAQSELNKDQETLDTTNTTIDRVNRFLFLNKNTDTGKISGLPGIKQVREATSPEFAEMSSLTDALTPSMRQGLPGAASERDTAMFRNATVGVGKDPIVNENVGKGLLVREQIRKDFIRFKNDYFDANGHLRGATSQWNKYLEANPIFDPDQPEGSFEINQNRQSSKDFFGGVAPKEKTSPQNIDDLVNKYAN